MIMLTKPGSVQAQPGFYQLQDWVIAVSKIHMEPDWASVKPSDEYVYIHLKATDGQPFYVGKGTNKRAFSRDRNKFWRRRASKHGVIVVICQDGLSMDDAHLLEMWLIAKLRHEGHDLCNLTDGGEGATGYITSEETKAKQSAIKKGIPRGPCPPEVREKISKSHIGLRPSPETLVKLRESHLGQRMREQSNKFDPIERVFRHPDHGEFIGVQYDLRHKYNLSAPCLTSVVKGNQRSVKGWTYHGTCDTPFEYVYKGGKNGRN